MKECAHGSFPGTCPVTTCRHHHGLDLDKVSDVKAGPIKATFASRCMAGPDPIDPGDVIVQVDGRWIHERCLT